MLYALSESCDTVAVLVKDTQNENSPCLKLYSYKQGAIEILKQPHMPWKKWSAFS